MNINKWDIHPFVKQSLLQIKIKKINTHMKSSSSGKCDFMVLAPEDKSVV